MSPQPAQHEVEQSVQQDDPVALAAADSADYTIDESRGGLKVWPRPTPGLYDDEEEAVWSEREREAVRRDNALVAGVMVAMLCAAGLVWWWRT